MLTFTKEQLIASAHARIEFAEMMLAGELEPLKERTWSIELELARIALASLEAEAVGEFYHEARWGWYEISERDSVPERARIPLYRVPPAPVSVPAAMEMDDDFDSAFEHGKAVGWNAYRAAMLQGAEPVTTDYKLPEGWVAVPVEPTAEMMAEAKRWTGLTRTAEIVYREMIAAAPQQEVMP